MKYLCNQCFKVHDTLDYVHFEPPGDGMSTRAEVMVIGPFKDLKRADVLDYPERFYGDIDPNTIVTGTAACAWTSSQSQRLAKICGVELWDLGNHKITNPVRSYSVLDNETIGSNAAEAIYDKIKKLVNNPRVEVWFRPNG